MQNKYEVPELTLVGEADDVVMGMGLMVMTGRWKLQRISNSSTTKLIIKQSWTGWLPVTCPERNRRIEWTLTRPSNTLPNPTSFSRFL